MKMITIVITLINKKYNQYLGGHYLYTFNNSYNNSYNKNKTDDNNNRNARKNNNHNKNCISGDGDNTYDIESHNNNRITSKVIIYNDNKNNNSYNDNDFKIYH